MKNRFILACLIILCLVASSSAAHPGRTDSQGGHTNRSTGEYHFHHGYPEHQHTNGVCPYDYHDNTDKNTHSNKANKPDTKRGDEPETPVLKEPIPVAERDEEGAPPVTFWDVLMWVVLGLLALPTFISLVITVFAIFYSLWDYIKGLFKKTK